jgi:ribonucleotide reductase alpha subunit
MRAYTYEEALAASVEYFGGEELPAKVFLDKYALRDNDSKILEPTPEYMHKRLAKEFARIDNEKYGLDYEERYNTYFLAMKNFARIVPQGSPMSAIGNSYQMMSASNCVVITPPQDNIKDIFRAGTELAQLYKRRCGVGTDLSRLRPDGFKVNNAAKTTTGAWSFADFYSFITRMIGQCVAKGERVLTDRGLVAIEDVEQNKDRVWTKKGWVNVNAVFSNGTKTVFEIQTTEGFTIKASADHIFLTEKDGELVEKRLKDFESGDDIILLPGNFVSKAVGASLLPVNYIKKGNNKSNRLNENVKFPSEINVDLAYFLGQFYGDGSVLRDKFDEPLNISISCAHSHPRVQEQLVKAIKSIFGLEPAVRKGDGAVNNVEIGSKLVGHWLQTNGLLKQYSYEIKVPSIILSSSTAIQLAFIAGFFDADGTNGKGKKGYTFTTTALSFAKDIQTMLMAAGIISKIHSEDRTDKGWRTLYSVSVTGKHAQEVLINYVDKGLFPAAKIYEKFIAKRDNYLTPYKAKSLDVKYNNYSYVPDNSYYISAACYNNLKKEGVLKAQDELLIKSSIQSISEVGETETFDLQLDEEHLFWCEGFYVHNSGRRGALMLTLDVHHPDVLKFATMKTDLTKVTGANISIRLSNEFMSAVDNDELYEQRWPCEQGETPIYRQMVKARDVWNVIVETATKTAEPGLIFWDTMGDYLPANSYNQFKISSTNPCCFDKESTTSVVTKEGIKEIKEIKSTDLIWIDSEKSWAKTSGYFDAGIAEVFKVTFSNGSELSITENHKLEKLTKESLRPVFYSKKLVQLKDLAVGDCISVHSNKVDFLNEGDSDCYGDGAILGWLSGDGCLSLKRDVDEWPTMYLPCWNGEFDVSEKLLKYTSRYSKAGICQSKDSYDNEIHKIASALITKGLSEKYNIDLYAFKKGRISFLDVASKNLIKGFLAAYFSADGTVADSPKESRFSIQLASVDKERLHQIKDILNLFGIRSSIALNKKAGISKIRNKPYNTLDLYRLTISGYENLLKFNSDIGFLSDRKQSKLETALSSFKTKGRFSESLAKITKIESLGVKSVGCIEVEKFHKFTANGIISGNSEIALSNMDSCRLISINLTGYVRNAFSNNASFDFEAYTKDIATAMQMIDNLVDLEIELINKIITKIKSENSTSLDIRKLLDGKVEESVIENITNKLDIDELEMWKKFIKSGHDGRRTGLGTHGLADTLSQLRIKYDSDIALKVVDQIYSTLRNTAYETSINLAKIRGPFPAWDWEVEKNNKFLLNLPTHLYKEMEKYGRRNISILCQAPTGSVSLLSKVGEFDKWNVSSGVEPVFMNFYTRRKKINPNDTNVRVDYVDAVGDSWQEFKVYHNNVQAYIEKTGSEILPDFFVTSDVINWDYRVNLQGVEQAYIDHSISSTVNLPAGTSSDVVGNIYLSAWKRGLKGVTVYVDGSRDGVLVTEKKPEPEKKELPKKDAPRRPKTLPSETHKIRMDLSDEGIRNAYVTVSFYEGQPYEILIGTPHSGLTEKDLQILELSSRMTSMCLRHGVPLHFICEQLDKIGGQYIHSVPVSLARTLRQYFEQPEEKETEEATPIYTKCPSCKAKTYRMTGQTCGICDSCGYSGCS